MRLDSTGGLEPLSGSARLSICPQKAARNTPQHAMNDEKYLMNDYGIANCKNTAYEPQRLNVLCLRH
jgi:hypothetical protein